MDDREYVSAPALLEQVETIFRNAGLSALQSSSVARTIVAAEQDDCKSHGLYRIEGALRTIAAGKVVIDAEPELAPDDGSAIVRVDAHGGFANSAFDAGQASLVARCKKLGIAAMAISNATHFSALWPDVEALAADGLASMIMCPSYSTVAPAGGTMPLFGTNPFAFGWPRENTTPYVFDFATSVVARGEIELHRRAGKNIPLGWAIDADGAPTTDPTSALAGAMLTFGGHKGSAISTMIELLAGVMIGDLMSSEALTLLGTTALSPSHGVLVIAMDPLVFYRRGGEGVFARAELLFDQITGQGARLPSQRRFEARTRAQASGIPLSPDEIRLLRRLHAGLA